VPTVFEAAEEIGGVWRPGSGQAWPGLRLNLSRYTCCFSSVPWPRDAPDFPGQPDLAAYLRRFAESHGVLGHIRFGQRVSSLAELDRFGGVVIATGIFAQPAVPALPGRFGGVSLPATAYRGPAALHGHRVIVVGLAFSGAEIAAELAAAGVEVTVVAARGMWLLSRYACGDAGAALPWDLLAYRRSARERNLALPAEQANRLRGRRYEESGANPAILHPRLRLDPNSGQPPHVVFADRLVAQARAGRLAVVPGRAVRLTAGGVRLDTGEDIRGDAVIWCTGYRPDLSLLAPAQRTALAYDPGDQIQPLPLHLGTFHPGLPGVAFVGMYRGPYFAVMELQARWACAVFARQLAPPAPAELRTGVATALAIRAQRPRPQFPYADYVGHADAIAARLGVRPALEQLWDDPVVSAHYRLTGRHARPEVAWAQIASVRERMREAAA